jgi:aminopeptidase N
MKKQLLAFLLFPTLVFAQEKNGSCAHVKAHANTHLKSNTFSDLQIAETERYDVHYYFLDLNMTNTSTTLSGSGEIHALARVVLDSALFEFYPTFTISQISVDGNPVAYNRTNSAVKVPVNKNAGENFVIRVEYNGTPPTAATNPLGGGGMTNASSPSWGNQVTWSLSEPFSAYEWFPVKQHLNDKADSCAVWLTVPTTCKGGSNGVLEQVTNSGNGTHRFEWKHRHPIAYYLISVAVAQYIEYNVTANPVGSGPVFIQNFIYNNPNTLPNFQADIDETVDFMELFAELFGPYPFADEKYGHCMAPIGGGMEHQTMSTQGFFTNTLTAHELAHQWFGNNVTCRSWADIWINEGFASYSEYLMLADLYPGQQVSDMLDRHNNIMSQIGGSVWVEDSLNDGRIFSGRLSYDKGAAIVHILRFQMNNDSLFFATLREFQEIYKDSAAIGTDFQEVAQNVTNMDFTNFMQEWYFGEGFPTYSVRWNDLGADLIIEINHTTSKPSVTPTFTNDLELRFDRVGVADTNYRFTITSNSNVFVIPNPGNMNNIISIDPSNWIINANGGIVKDPNFTAGIDDVNVEEVTIYPNPSNGTFTVNCDFKNAELIVIDTKGTPIKHETFSGSTTINICDYASGTYLLQIKDPNTERTIRRLITKN